MTNEKDTIEVQRLTPTPLQTGTYNARPWELVRCDPTAGGCVVVLPVPSGAKVRGSWIYIKNVSDSLTPIKIEAVSSTIDGQRSVALTVPRSGVASFYSVGDDGWERGPSTT